VKHYCISPLSKITSSWRKGSRFTTRWNKTTGRKYWSRVGCFFQMDIWAILKTRKSWQLSYWNFLKNLKTSAFKYPLSTSSSLLLIWCNLPLSLASI
jgi:hypothetical protein